MTLRQLFKIQESVDPNGYLDSNSDNWSPYKVIPGNRITMQGVSQNIYALPFKKDGTMLQGQFMHPGAEYEFPEADYVIEVPEKKVVPRFQQGGALQKQDTIFDPEGNGYDYATAIRYGIEPDSTGHWPSRVPQTGQILKGRKHPTFYLTEQGEKESGYKIIKGKDGRYFSTKLENGGDISKKSDKVNIENLDSNITEYLNTLEPEYRAMLLATSGSEGQHAKNSRHYKNQAIDLRFNEQLYNRIVKDPNRLKYGITLLDPKHGTAPHIHLSTGNATENKKDVWMDPHSKEAENIVVGLGNNQNTAKENVAVANTTGTEIVNPPTTTVGTASLPTTQAATHNVDTAVTYAAMPKEEKKEVKETAEATGMTEAQVRQILANERADMEKRFIQALQQQQQVAQEPQQQEEVLVGMDPLYNYIDIENYQDGGQYTIKRGDSLSKIARDNGLSMEQLLSLNEQYRDNPNLIRVGETLALSAPQPVIQ